MSKEYNLIDQNPESNVQRKVGITGDSNLVSVEFDGYNNLSTCDSVEFGEGQRTVVGFEVWQGELRCLVWGDINQEEPTHIINLDDALVTRREDEDE